MKWIIILSMFVSCNALKTLTDGDTKIPENFALGQNSSSLDEQLLAFFKFNNVAPVIFDRTNTYNLNNISNTAPTLVSGIRGTAANCGAGASSAGGMYQNSIPTLTFSASENYSFSFHISTSVYTSAMGGTIFELTGGVNANPAILIGDFDSNADQNDFRFQIGANQYNWNNSIPLSGLNHFAVNVFNGGTSVELFLNGISLGTQANSPMIADADEFLICSDNAGGFTLNGIIDSFGMWRRILNFDEIQMLKTGNTHLD